MELSILIAGFGGGAIRGLVGFVKHQYSYKEVKFNVPYFFFMMFLSGVVGVTVASAVSKTGFVFFGGSGLTGLTPALALIVGYAGGDFLENVYKIIMKKP